jgi:hypothetical protein
VAQRRRESWLNRYAMNDRQHDHDEREPGPFAPDSFLPSQYFDRLRHGERSGEWRLLVAILEDAVNVYRKQVGARDPRGRQLFQEAEEWIEDPDRTWIFSFENICDLIGLEADWLRRGLRAWKEEARRDSRKVEVEVSAREPAPEPLRKASGE